MKYILLIFIIFFTACSVKNYEITKSKLISIKSPKIKFSDLGFIRSSGNGVEMELFMAGKLIEKITINYLMCSNEGCMLKSSFNEEYLSKYYPDDILQNILLSKKIYNGKNIKHINYGFEQYIKDENVDIKYKVDSKTIYFKDRKNKILIKIKDING
jgi:hypothetical protein